MFYGKKEDKPILVEGQLVVYAFDETNRAVTDNKPTRRYVFPPDQIEMRMSKSELGASYSFWLPWDEAGGPQTEISLICRFEPKSGGVITSEQTRHRLPGTITAAPALTADGRPAPPKLPEGVPSRPAQPTLESVQASRMHDPNLQLASFESAVPNNSVPAATGALAAATSVDPQRQMATTTITLPPNYQLPMGTVTAGPLPQQSGGTPPQLMQPQTQAIPIQQQQPVMTPMVPAQQQVPPAVNTMPGVQPALQNPRLGAFPMQVPGTPTVASPTVYSPTFGGIGAGLNAASQPQQATQPVVPQVGRMAHAQMIPWNSVQTTTVQNAPANLVPQQQVNGTPQQPRTITQPASQPMPPASGLTTAVSYPTTPAPALR